MAILNIGAGNSEGWGIELQGHGVNLDDLQEWLKPPFNPWVERFTDSTGEKYLLRSSSWAAFSEAADVVRDAERLVQRLHGEALLLQHDAEPLILGRVFRFDANGNSLPVVISISVTAHLKGLRARAKVGSFAPTPPPTESQMQAWSRESDHDDTRADLFTLLARADNWFDIYKTMELARKIAKGKNAVKAALSKADFDEWERIWQTANCARHGQT